MLRQRLIHQAAGAVAFSVLAGTSAFAAAPSPAAVGSATAAKIVAAMPAVDRAGAGQTASKNLHQVARKGRRGMRRGFRGHRAYRHRGFRHRGHRRLRGHYYHRRHGGAIAAGIAGLIIGGAIVSSKRHYHDRWEACDARYRTFRWSDGTYIPYVGAPRVLCPYLRR